MWVNASLKFSRLRKWAYQRNSQTSKKFGMTLQSAAMEKSLDEWMKKIQQFFSCHCLTLILKSWKILRVVGILICARVSQNNWVLLSTIGRHSLDFEVRLSCSIPPTISNLFDEGCPYLKWRSLSQDLSRRPLPRQQLFSTPKRSLRHSCLSLKWVMKGHPSQLSRILHLKCHVCSQNANKKVSVNVHFYARIVSFHLRVLKYRLK